MSTHLAIDIGGSHGRGVLGVYEDGQEKLVDLGSFSTAPLCIDGQLSWNTEEMLAGICRMLSKAAALGHGLDSLGIDTMGLAFGLLDEEDEMLCPAVYTRTHQDEDLKSEIISHFGREKLYAINGLEQRKLNSLYYLAKIKKEKPELIESCAHMLMLPDLLNYFLSGEVAGEYTIATTSALWDLERQGWSDELREYIGLRAEALPTVNFSVKPVGRLLPERVSEPSLSDARIVSVAAHDTASAFCALPEEDREQLLISCGTWGMIGCILDEPILSAAALEAGFANEGAADGKIKFLNNAPNMSILKACKDFWTAAGQCWDWPELFEQAELAGDPDARVDLYHPEFRELDNMPEKIKMYCHSTGQKVPEGPGEITAVILASIAGHYGTKFGKLRKLSGRNFVWGTMVGGAARNQTFVRLCQNELGIPIKTGPSEASVLGNIRAQRGAYMKGLY